MDESKRWVFSGEEEKCIYNLYGAIVPCGERQACYEARLEEGKKGYDNWAFLKNYELQKDFRLTEKEYAIVDTIYKKMSGKTMENKVPQRIDLLKWLFLAYEHKFITAHSLLRISFVICEKQHSNTDYMQMFRKREEYFLVAIQPYFIINKFYNLYKDGKISEQMNSKAYYSCVYANNIASLKEEQEAYKIDYERITRGSHSQLIISEIKFYSEFQPKEAVNYIYKLINEYCDATCNSNEEIMNIEPREAEEYLNVINTIIELYEDNIIVGVEVYDLIYMLIRKIENEDAINRVNNIGQEQLEDCKLQCNDEDVEEKIRYHINFTIKEQNRKLREDSDRMCLFLSAYPKIPIYKRVTTKRILYYTIYNSVYWSLFYPEERKQLLREIDLYLENKWETSKKIIELSKFKKFIGENCYCLGISWGQHMRILVAISLWAYKRKNGKDCERDSIQLVEDLGISRKLKSKWERVLLQNKLSEKSPRELAEYLNDEMPCEYFLPDVTVDEIEEYLKKNRSMHLKVSNLEKRIDLWNNQIVKMGGVLKEEIVKKRLLKISQTIDTNLAIEDLRECYGRSPYIIKFAKNEVPLDDDDDDRWSIADMEEYISIVDDQHNTGDIKIVEKILQCLYYMGQKGCDIQRLEEDSVFIASDKKEFEKDSIFTDDGKEEFEKAIKADYLRKPVSLSILLESVCKELEKDMTETIADQKDILKFFDDFYKLDFNFKESIQSVEQGLYEELTQFLPVTMKVRQLLQEYVCIISNNAVLDDNIDISTLSYILEDYGDFNSLFKAKLLIEDIKKITLADVELDLYFLTFMKYYKKKGDEKKASKLICKYVHEEMTKEVYLDLKEEIVNWIQEIEATYKKKNTPDNTSLFELYCFEQVMGIGLVNNIFLEKLDGGYIMIDKWINVGRLEGVCSRNRIYSDVKNEKISFNQESCDVLNYYLVEQSKQYYENPHNCYDIQVHALRQLKSNYKWDMVEKRIKESDDNFKIYVECYNIIKNNCILPSL